jgi:hypothetical protein
MSSGQPLPLGSACGAVLGFDGVPCSAIELEEIAAHDAAWAPINLPGRPVGSRLDARELKSLIPVAG